MQIIDIHAHVYPKVAGITNGLPMASLGYGRVTVGNEVRQLLPPSFEKTASTLETLLAYMDWCGIEKAILMSNPYYGYHNEYLAEGVRRYPDRFRGVALVDILKGEAAARELAAIYDEKLLMGFKIEVNSTFQCAPQTHLADPVLAPVWGCCNDYHQPVFFHLFRDCDVEDLAILVKRYPHIQFVLCHMGADACFGRGVRAGNYETLLSLVKENNHVFMDTSTVPEYCGEEYPFPSAVKKIEHAYRAVGPEKLLWASDYPGMLGHATLKQLINYVMNGCTAIPAHHMELIMGENARRLFF